MRASLLVAGIAALISAQAVSAQVIYQSIPDFAAAPVFHTCSPCDPVQVAGSKFSLSSAASINAIQYMTGDYGWGWWGPTHVQVSIYRDEPADWDGTVGEQLYLHDFTDYTSADQADGDHLLGLDTTGLNLEAGTYLIFFTNTTALAPAVYSGGSMLYAWPDDPYDFTGYGYSNDDGYSEGFALIGTQNDAPPSAPEPASWAMMVAGFGLAGFALRRRARIRFA